jgi:hypothetical protein
MVIFALVFVMVIIGAFLAQAIYVVCVMRTDQPLDALLHRVRAKYPGRRQVFDGAAIIVLLSVFGSTFTSLKTIIPIIHPYDWDATFMAWDTALHFGVAPWLLLQPILGVPIVTSVVDWIYGSWLFVLAGCWVWQAFARRDPALRMQFFVSYMACFAVLGTLAATWYASGGPCYYGRLVAGADPYAPLMEYLRQTAAQSRVEWSVMAQEMLWASYTSGRLELGSGISAMPSMHVGGAVLCALLGWRSDRRLGRALSLYAGAIMVGSVHLGWHYAVDGYFAALGTLAIWWFVGTLPGMRAHQIG